MPTIGLLRIMAIVICAAFVPMGATNVTSFELNSCKMERWILILPCAFFTRYFTGVLDSLLSVVSNPFTICVMAGNAIGTKMPTVIGLGVVANEIVLNAISVQKVIDLMSCFIAKPHVNLKTVVMLHEYNKNGK